MDGHDPARQVLVPHAPPAGLLHERGQPLLVGPGQDRFAQVVVGLGAGGHESCGHGQRRAQVEAVQTAEGAPGGRGELSDDRPPPRPRHTCHLPQGADGVLHVAQPVGDGDDVEGLIGEGQGGGIPGDEGDPRVPAPALGDHAGGEVAGDDVGAVGRVAGRRGPGAGRQVEHPHARPGGDGGAGDRAPHGDLPQTRNVVGQVIATCDGVEHARDLARVLGKGGSAHGRNHRRFAAPTVPGPTSVAPPSTGPPPPAPSRPDGPAKPSGTRSQEVSNKFITAIDSN